MIHDIAKTHFFHKENYNIVSHMVECDAVYITNASISSGSEAPLYLNIICDHKLLFVLLERETGPKVHTYAEAYCSDILSGFKLVTYLKIVCSSF